MKAFGEKLKQLRVQHDLTLIQLAEALGYSSHGYLSEIESGRKSPTTQLVLKVSNYFTISTDILLNDQATVYPISQIDSSSGSEGLVPIIDRAPTRSELERFRLILSSFQDGTGMLYVNELATLPGWRDFERAVAVAFGGFATENKSLFDVLLPDKTNNDSYYGISCKMRNYLRLGYKDTALLEITNANSAIWTALTISGVSREGYLDKPRATGISIVNLINRWYADRTKGSINNIDTSKSVFLTLQYDRALGIYQLSTYSIQLPNPEALVWESKKNSIRGLKNGQMILEFYGGSGGQVKYYPRLQDALWKSDIFSLEPIPRSIETGLVAKARQYFPEKWKATGGK